MLLPKHPTTRHLSWAGSFSSQPSSPLGSRRSVGRGDETLGFQAAALCVGARRPLLATRKRWTETERQTRAAEPKAAALRCPTHRVQEKRQPSQRHKTTSRPPRVPSPENLLRVPDLCVGRKQVATSVLLTPTKGQESKKTTGGRPGRSTGGLLGRTGQVGNPRLPAACPVPSSGGPRVPSARGSGKD